MTQSRTAHLCHGCNKPPESCECLSCDCGVCKSYRIPKDERAKIIADQDALLTSHEEAKKLREIADKEFEVRLSATAVESELP